VLGTKLAANHVPVARLDLAAFGGLETIEDFCITRLGDCVCALAGHALDEALRERAALVFIEGESLFEDLGGSGRHDPSLSADNVERYHRATSWRYSSG